MFNKSNGRNYQAQRYIMKYISVIGGIAMQLAEMNYLWDYIQQRPFLNAKIDAMKKIDKYRESIGMKPLYSEYLESFDYSILD